MNKCKGEGRKGRKPKGGKMVIIPSTKNDVSVKKSNIILHLKCTMMDLDAYEIELYRSIKNSNHYNPIVDPEIIYTSYNEIPSYSMYDNDDDKDILPLSLLCENDKIDESSANCKIHQLKKNYHYNTIANDKKSACFWCTYDYEGMNFLIPKHIIDGEEIGYGSFCSPECASAFLMKENIDDSSKFERYHLLNNKYRHLLPMDHNIKPSPDPHYMLEKFYGNLSIDEYRDLVKKEHTFVIIEKPLTRILPELYEENENFNPTFYGCNGINNINLKSIAMSNNDCRNIGSYKVKRQSDVVNVPSKNSIMKKNFKL